jgi:hypothetical protein
MAKSLYPDMQGQPTKALPDILGPLNIDHEGDKLVPGNDMIEVAGAMCDGKGSPDPLGLLRDID